ncbi:hypothetical protein Pmani_002300 [Petrolisthes manimaculis]|uniref:Uncharacterized protein n=1 Tax=Petrolisthes manimaculis TaxID=1843537 RepID=A0AAE1UJH5_9EUCA|nr:hypothetical protein Pmani_002300 [Petrolisthes manimaculis]
MGAGTEGVAAGACTYSSQATGGTGTALRGHHHTSSTPAVGLGFIPSSYGAQQRWYYDIALRSGDPYAAKAIGGGNYAIQTADAAAISAPWCSGPG